MTDPIEDLQMRVAHQELAIESLNETVMRQDQMLSNLQAELAILRERLLALQPSPLGEGDGPEPPPPHY
jgi:SlyX protein